LDAISDHVAQNREQLERLRRLVARLSDDDRRAAILLERFVDEGVFASPYDYETINAALPHLTRRIPPRDIVAEVVEAAEAADRADHRRSHLDDIEALLESR
jgi:hypothetical protein